MDSYIFIDHGLQINNKPSFSFLYKNGGTFVCTESTDEKQFFTSYNDFEGECDLADREILLALIPDKFKITK